ncbi:putative transcriptional regulator, PAS and GerE domains (plasmid) [Candidatus Regiella insecticola LSR1]|uniref:Putative transcriptional regulator, PAS and GerE domains n=1 Tax=Candidatus Regiella insecticola LSR1 TaxID=663321 RepID=E0R988_9ENTR|nr:PAS domain-containing protein [Candidatus Regiella insecticola]EFL92807.1 putative transcriptional regulator, PAS and GerE domains [Candidatus Regiella insecticola LSR1]
MHFNPKDISPQIIYLLNNHPHPCHIRDKASRYLYMNLAMRDFLNLPTGFPIEGKESSEIKPEKAGFFEGIYQKEEVVIQKETPVSLLITGHFGKDNQIQPYIVDIHPFFDETGQLMGTLAEARQCLFFSPLDYLQGKSPKTLTTSIPNTIFTQNELQIIFYAYHALSSKEVGEYLNLSHRTAENKLQGIYEKMGVHHQKGFRKYIQDSGLNHFIPQNLLASSIQLID